jgi:peptidoglycan/LPS O-acetylase OafA/YrhL
MVLILPILLGLLAVWLIVSNFKIPVFFYPRLVVYAFYILLVYGILFFAYHPKLQVKSFHKLGDYSYGLYIYAFPIQQLIVLKAGLLNPFVHFICTFPLALGVAALSWHFIEKTMLGLKTLSFFTKVNKI